MRPLQLQSPKHILAKKKKSNLKALGQLLSVPKKLELGTKHVNI